MCSDSTEYGETRTWCGTGWTGQPAVFERSGVTWVVFGAYDAKIHFVDAATGEDLLPPLQTGDLAKGAITVDPDGYPLVYAGSRDAKLRVIAIDRPEPTVLWALDAGAAGEGRWNDDWDAAPLVVNGYLVEGGENSRLHVIELGRGYDGGGLVTAAPRLAWSAPGWDDRLLRDLGDHRVSFESSVTLLGDIAYLANSGGLVQGWDLSSLRTGVGEPVRVFRFWTGDDTDATIVGDAQGFLYVGVEVDRDTARGDEVGQFLKLDPRQPDDPVVWSVNVDHGRDSGTWSTPAIVGDTVIWPTKPGTVYGLDRASGAERWTLRLPGPLLASPAVVDGALLLGDSAGILHAFDLGESGTTPTERWRITLGGTIESTAAVWRGSVYLGTRDGHLFAIGDAP
jgi:outer membrane protein assembly factor BamB